MPADRAAAPRLQCKEVKSILRHRLRRQDKTFGRLAQSRIDHLSFVPFLAIRSPLSFQERFNFVCCVQISQAYTERYRVAV